MCFPYCCSSFFGSNLNFYFRLFLKFQFRGGSLHIGKKRIACKFNQIYNYNKEMFLHCFNSVHCTHCGTIKGRKYSERCGERPKHNTLCTFRNNLGKCPRATSCMFQQCSIFSPPSNSRIVCVQTDRNSSQFPACAEACKKNGTSKQGFRRSYFESKQRNLNAKICIEFQKQP